jgi:hypothetical protein
MRLAERRCMGCAVWGHVLKTKKKIAVKYLARKYNPVRGV